MVLHTKFVNCFRRKSKKYLQKWAIGHKTKPKNDTDKGQKKGIHIFFQKLI